MRLRDEPIFHWVELDQNLQPKDDSLKADIKYGIKIILKRMAVQNCRIKQVYYDLKPRQAQPQKLPYIFSGNSYPKPELWTIGFGESAALRAPMAIAVIGGLISSTILTLIVIPCIYYYVERLRY